METNQLVVKSVTTVTKEFIVEPMSFEEFVSSHHGEMFALTINERLVKIHATGQLLKFHDHPNDCFQTFNVEGKLNEFFVEFREGTTTTFSLVPVKLIKEIDETSETSE